MYQIFDRLIALCIKVKSPPIFLCTRDDSQGALRFAPVCPSVCLSVRSSHFTVKHLCDQLLPEFSVDLETLHTCYGHIEDVLVGF